MSSTLRSVSRSFYLSLRVLPAPVRAAMAAGYLLCRTADTIADVDGAARLDRVRLLRRFKNGLDTFPGSGSDGAQTADDLREFAGSLKGPEKELLDRLPESMALFGRLSLTDRALVRQVVGAVVDGMLFDLDAFGETAETVKALPTESELERYLHWIGGEPGRFWSQVCLAHLPGLSIRNRDKWLADGMSFGTGLQMINILRDVAADLKIGRCYIPETLLRTHGLSVEDLAGRTHMPEFFTLYHRLIDDTLSRLRHGLDYLEQLPAGAYRLRAAVWWPLSIAVSTLEKLRVSEDVLDPAKRIKISRGETYWLLGSSAACLGADGFLKRSFERRAELASSSF